MPVTPKGKYASLHSACQLHAPTGAVHISGWQTSRIRLILISMTACAYAKILTCVLMLTNRRAEAAKCHVFEMKIDQCNMLACNALFAVLTRKMCKELQLYDKQGHRIITQLQNSMTSDAQNLHFCFCE